MVKLTNIMEEEEKGKYMDNYIKDKQESVIKLREDNKKDDNRIYNVMKELLKYIVPAFNK